MNILFCLVDCVLAMFLYFGAWRIQKASIGRLAVLQLSVLAFACTLFAVVFLFVELAPDNYFVNKLIKLR